MLTKGVSVGSTCSLMQVLTCDHTAMPPGTFEEANLQGMTDAPLWRGVPKKVWLCLDAQAENSWNRHEQELRDALKKTPHDDLHQEDED